MPAQLILGSAQFGSDYGVVNFTGRVPDDQVEEILIFARKAGVNCIDTAAAYGDAEQVLGAHDLSGFEVITKVPAIGVMDLAQTMKSINDFVKQSCANLRLENLNGVLLHSACDLTGDSGKHIYAGLRAVREAGLTKKIGISVYCREEIEVVLAKFPLDIIQLPLSVLDQRLLACLKRIADRGIEVHVRSIFLQGIMLFSSENLPPRLAPLIPGVLAFQRSAAAQGLTALEAAIAFVRDLPEIAGIVIGATRIEEFRASVKAFNNGTFFDATSLGLTGIDLVDPRVWAT